MQSVLDIKQLHDKAITRQQFQALRASQPTHEFALYADNILEGLSLLNALVLCPDEVLILRHVIYQPIAQPTYVFSDVAGQLYCIKICGSFSNWELPDDVRDLETFIDIPDFVIYSIEQSKVVLAGESTETASVGNSQWQREGRKIGAARNGVPFIYQTFYAGKDESQDTIREPTSLQVYNHFLYSVRYQTPSFTVYFDNNFEDANTRRREVAERPADIFTKYVKHVLVASVDEAYVPAKRAVEASLYQHMLSYMTEGRLKANGSIEAEPRFVRDFPMINSELKAALLDKPAEFIDELVAYVNHAYPDDEQFRRRYRFADFNYQAAVNWTSYNHKPFIDRLISVTKQQGQQLYSYAARSKVGITQTAGLLSYLTTAFPDHAATLELLFKAYPEAIVMPLRIHKTSKGLLTFAPDPESGEIAAFAELFGYDDRGVKIRPVLGYCIVETGEDFDLNSKAGTKLYKSIAQYVDFLVINGHQPYATFAPHVPSDNRYIPSSLDVIVPKGTTEEVAVVSTFLQMTKSSDGWQLCFIHTHHSSWQQMLVYKDSLARKMKIQRVSSKVDLVMQRDADTFLVAEGKKKYSDFFVTAQEIQKIKAGIKNTGDYIEQLLEAKTNNINAFICMIDMPTTNTQAFLTNKIRSMQASLHAGQLHDIAASNFVVIAVYELERRTHFQLFFSDDFEADLQRRLEAIFKTETA